MTAGSGRISAGAAPRVGPVAPLGRALRAGRVATVGVAAALVAAWLAAVGLSLSRAGDLPEIAFAAWSTPAGRSVLADWGVPVTGWLAYVALLSSVVVAASVVAGYLILRAAVSWFRLYLVVALILFATAGSWLPLVVGALHPPVADAAQLLQGLGWVVLFPLAYLFPDGRFVPRWSRWLALAWVGYLIVGIGADLLGMAGGAAEVVDGVVLLLLAGSAAAAQIYRYRRVSDAVARQQTRWVMLALALWFAFGLVLNLTPLQQLYFEASPRGLVTYAVVDLVTAAILGLIPAAVAVAIVRYRLFEVDVWISRTLVYGVLSAFVVGTYALIVGGVGALWRGGGNVALPMLATGLVAVAFHPLRARVQRRINRLVYGRRDDPYAVVAQLGRRLAGTVPPERVLRTIVDTIGTAMRFPYVALTVAGDGSGAAVFGTPPVGAGEPATFPVRYHDEELGELRVTARPRERLTGRDRGLLEEVARQAGIAVRAATLTADLRRSRERLVTAREEERRRLHRDLHDGLGPTLASLYQRIDAARGLLLRDPDAAQRLLDEVQAHTRSTIGEIRQLVYSLRPPALDELGLVAAIEEATRQLNARPHRLSVDVVTAGPLPTLPAVVEVAAYRIAVESVTNMVRHSGADHCTVRVAVVDDGRRDGAGASPYLLVEVADDGAGIAAGARPGSGLRTMRERAEEIGGTFRLADRRPTGTVVSVTLPLNAAPDGRDGPGHPHDPADLPDPHDLPDPYDHQQ